MASKLDKLCARARRLGVGPEVATLLAHYLDEVERLGAQCDDFRWGDPRCEHVQVVTVPPPDSIAYELGPLVSVVYEAAKGGELCEWAHDFQPALPVLAWGDSGRLLILGGDYKVSARGIVG
jgi:hypothetical protein